MFNCTKGPYKFIYFIGAFISKNQRFISTKKSFTFFENYTSQIRLYGVMQNKLHKINFLVINYQSRLPIMRNKSKNKGISYKKRDEYESSDDDDDDDDEKRELEDEDSDLFKKDSETVTYSLKSMRIDLILKSILNINRKKVEEYFYQNKIRVNGRILQKKSQNAKIGDQIDLIYGIDNFKLNSLKIGRVQIVEAEEDEDHDKVILKVLRSKSLIISNNSYEDEWREPIKEE